MKNYLIRVDGVAGELSPKNKRYFTLEELYNIIGCELIEIITLPSGYYMIVDEEGRLKGKPLNRLASSIYGGIIVGNAVVCNPSMIR